MKSITRSGLLAALIAAIALVAPAVTSAHPSVYKEFPNTAVGTAPAPITLAPAANPRYVVANHGYVKVLNETNGESTGAVAGGLLNFMKIPGAWRNQADPNKPSKADWFTQAQTGAQPHATCSGVPQLTESVILAWQGADPFYSYIPWQKDAALLDDNPASWLGVIQTATGVDLNTADPATSCASLGGTFRPADTQQSSGASFASGNISLATAAAVAPLNTQIGGLTTQVADLTTQLGTVTGERDTALADASDAAAEAAAEKARADAAEADAAALRDRELAMVMASKRFSIGSDSVMVTGQFSKSVSVKVEVSKAQARKLRLGSSVIATGAGSTGEAGAALISLKPGAAAMRAMRSLRGGVPVTVTATLEDSTATSSAVVTR
jgi:hypothetical protein